MGYSHPFPHHRLPRGAGRLALLAVLLAFTCLPALTAPRPAAAEALGGGSYSVTATVFGPESDGGQTSSGYVLRGQDNLVALPACTESSCPWLSSTNPTPAATERWGPQTLCAEADGLCWVEIRYQGPQTNGAETCTVAPVRDVGPLFTNDNWWAPTAQRMYDLPQGEPAAEAAAGGADLGYGPGISNVGNDIQNRFHYAAGIDIGEGTRDALQLTGAGGIFPLKVRLLWQAGLTHDQACGNVSTPPPPATDTTNATVTEDLNLRGGPSTGDTVLDVMPGGTRITVTGDPQNGFYPVTYGATNGWAFGDWITLDNPPAPPPPPPPPPSQQPANATVTEDLNLRAGPSTGDTVLAVMPGGARIAVTGVARNGFFPVTYNGTSGWAYGDWIRADNTAPPPPPPSQQEPNATVTEDLNLRGGPSTGDTVLAVMPGGARVTVTGAGSNGFYPVVYNGTAGWAFGDWIRADGASPETPPDTSMATVTEALNLRTGPSTSNQVISVMPAGALVTLTGQGQNGFVSVNYNGTDGWAYAAYLSGGAPPATGGQTVQTTDSLNLRAGPGLATSVLLVMPSGATVTLTGATQNGFQEVVYNGTRGWASSDYLSGFPTGTVDSALNLRSDPSLQATVLTVMPGGATVQVLGVNQSGFAKVVYQGTTGWAYAAYLR